MTAVTTMAPKPSSSSTKPRMRPTNRPMTLGCTDPPRDGSGHSGRGPAGAPAAPPAGGPRPGPGPADEDDGHAAPAGAGHGAAAEGAVGVEGLGERRLVAPPVG